MKICVFGGGAIGGFIAGHLARSGHCEVSVVSRGQTLHHIQRDGIHVTTPAGVFTAPIRAVENTGELGPQDYIFITLKMHQLESALDQIALLIGPDSVIIPPTTGLPYYFFYGAAAPYRDCRLPAIDPGGRLWAAMPPSQVLGCVYWIGAHSTSPGVVVQDGARAGAPIGELDGTKSERAVILSDLMRASGISAPVRDNIRGETWTKFVNSLCWNPVAILTMARMGEMAASPGVIPLIETMMREADATGQKLGITIPQTPEQRITTTLSVPMHKMSMLQDFEAGRALELESLDRSIKAASELAAVATPALDAVLALSRLRAGTAAKQRPEGMMN